MQNVNFGVQSVISHKKCFKWIDAKKKKKSFQQNAT